jgi:hypothetical protein
MILHAWSIPIFVNKTKAIPQMLTLLLNLFEQKMPGDKDGYTLVFMMT